MKTVLAFLISSVVAAAANGPVREVTSQAFLVGLQPVPGFQKGYLFFLDHQANVELYKPDGSLAFTRVLELPKAASLSATGLAVDTDGGVAVSVAYQTGGRFGGGIFFLDSTGRQTAFVDTGLYMPGNLCFGEDQALWAFGWQRSEGQDHAEPSDYLMVRKYSPDRKEAGRYLPRSLFPKGLEPGSPSWQQIRIAVAHNKLGLLAWSGVTSSHGEWVELDLDGNLIRRVPMYDPRVGEIAFTPDGHLYRLKHGSKQLLVLDQTTSAWKDAGPSPLPCLWGADGKQLVFSTYERGPIHLQWFEEPISP